jgi:plastocyanin
VRNPPAIRRLVGALAFLTLWAGGAPLARAGGLEAFVKDTDGKPVADAVISAVAVSGSRPVTTRVGRAIVDQVDKEFVPHVRPVLVGTEVSFPNKDNIRHHVYSFSPAKKFELPLYRGTEAPPVKFDKPGVVVLGCNIHDWMLGYVYVLETPYFDTTGVGGRARIEALPAGAYEIHLWHPRLPEGAPPSSQRVTIAADKDERVEFVVSLKPDLRPRRAPSGAGGTYR